MVAVFIFLIYTILFGYWAFGSFQSGESDKVLAYLFLGVFSLGFLFLTLRQERDKKKE